jgi:hypothetical protein
MIGAKEDSLELRSVRRSLRNSCHAGSAMSQSERLESEGLIDLILTLSALRARSNRRHRPALAGCRALPPKEPKFKRQPTFTIPPMGRVLLKVLYYSFFFLCP